MRDKYHNGVPTDHFPPIRCGRESVEDDDYPRRVVRFLALFLRLTIFLQRRFWRLSRWRTHKAAVRALRIRGKERFTSRDLFLNLLGFYQEREDFHDVDIGHLAMIAKATGATMMGNVPGLTQIANPTGAFQGTAQVPPYQDQSTLALAGQGIDLPTNGSSTVDDGAAINTILTANPNGVFTFSPNKTYSIGVSVQALSGQTIFAYGATIKRISTATANLLVVGQQVTNVRIYGGNWDGFRSGSSNPGFQYLNYAGMKFSGCTDVWVFDATAQNCFAGGFTSGSTNTVPFPSARMHFVRCHAINNMDSGFNMRPGIITISMVDCWAIGNNATGAAFIRCDYVDVVGGGSYHNGPDAVGEGDGIDFQGVRYGSVTDYLAFGNSRSGFYMTTTSEAPVGVNWRGAWSSGATYAAKDAFTYNGLTYACYSAPPGTGFPPSTQNDLYFVLAPYDSGGQRNASHIHLANVTSVNNNGRASRGKWSSATSYVYNDSSLYTDGDVYAALPLPTTPGITILGSTRANLPGGVTDAGATGSAVSSTITDAAVQAGDAGARVTGTNIPNPGGVGAFVGTVTPGVSFVLLDNNGNPLNPSGAVAGVTLSFWSKLTTSGAWSSQGFYADNTDGLVLDNCTADNNAAHGIQIGNAVTRLKVNSPTCINNGNYGFRAEYTDGGGGNFFVIDNPNFQYNAWSGCAFAQSIAVKGGTISNNTQAGASLNGGSAANTKFNFEHVTFADNGAGWGGVFQNAANNNVFIEVLHCDFPNSAVQPYAVFEQSGGAGTITTLVDYCQLGTQATATVSFLSTNSKLGGHNTVYPGGTGVSIDHVNGSGTLAAATTTPVTFPTALYRAPNAQDIQLSFTGDPGASTGLPFVTTITASGFTINFHAAAAAVGYSYKVVCTS